MSRIVKASELARRGVQLNPALTPPPGTSKAAAPSNPEEGSAPPAHTPKSHEARAAAILEASEVIQTARVRAAAMIEAAQAQAVEMVTQAEADAEAIRAQAQESGYEAGRKEGAQRAKDEAEAALKQRAEELLSQLAGALDAAAQARAALLKGAEGELLRLALAIAEKMVRRELEGDRELVRRLLDELIQRVENQNVTVKLHPDDAEALSSWHAASEQGERRIKITTDPHIDRGGAVLETEWGAFDARLGSRWRRIEGALEDEMSEQGE